jgi:hypothetical protein
VIGDDFVLFRVIEGVKIGDRLHLPRPTRRGSFNNSVLLKDAQSESWRTTQRNRAEESCLNS